MRVLISDEDGFIVCVEITDIGYTDCYEVDSNSKMEGLYMYDYCDCTIFLPRIDRNSAKRICQGILISGFYDLSGYGNCFVASDDDV